MLQPDAPAYRKNLRQRWQDMVRRCIWRSDIAPGAWIHCTALIDRTFPKGIVIGDRAWIGPYALVLAHDMSRGLYLTTSIGARSIIGARAVIMPGVTIGQDCVVDPGAVVSRDMADGERVAGNPARVWKDGA